MHLLHVNHLHRRRLLRESPHGHFGAVLVVAEIEGTALYSLLLEGRFDELAEFLFVEQFVGMVIHAVRSVCISETSKSLVTPQSLSSCERRRVEVGSGAIRE